MIPVGGTYTVDADNASEISKALNPSIVIPMHFKTEKCQLPISGVDGFLRKMENVKRLNVSEIEISKDAIPLGGQEVWVLDYAN
jgi:L-ascorbate metabolism protein UlaG (beta-lactamase superfamily)